MCNRNDMSNFREKNQVKRRLLAHYKNALGIESFPIQLSASSAEIDSLARSLNIGDDEFLINKYSLILSFELYITSRRLVFKREENLYSVDYENLMGVFLKFPFKKEDPPHELNLISDGNVLYVVSFLNLSGLVEARNEIYRVINATIVDWRGRDFKVNDELRECQVVNLPASLN